MRKPAYAPLYSRQKIVRIRVMSASGQLGRVKLTLYIILWGVYWLIEKDVPNKNTSL